MAKLSAPIRRRAGAESRKRRSPRSCQLHSASTCSGLPLTASSVPPRGASCIVTMYRRSWLRYSVPRSGIARRTAGTSNPAAMASRTRAVSVGVPMIAMQSARRRNLTSLHNAMILSKRTSSGRASAMLPIAALLCQIAASLASYRSPPQMMAAADIWFWVRVPVLSKAMTFTAARVSIASRRRTSTSRRRICSTPIARVVVARVGSPSGTAATARATAALSICRKPTLRKRPMTSTAAHTVLDTMASWPPRASS